MSPPDEEGAQAAIPGATATSSQQPTSSSDRSRRCRDQPYDVLGGNRGRRETAVRLPGRNPDPLQPGRRYHRPTTGLRADGYRTGWRDALEWVLDAHAGQIDELLRLKLRAIIERSVNL